MCTHTPSAVRLCTVIVSHIHCCAPHCIAVRQATKRVVPLHIASRRRSQCASHGGPSHTALVCVLTARHHVYVHHGTTSVLPHIHIYSRHPPHCMCAIQCHMRIVARRHTPPQDQPVPGTRTCQGPRRQAGTPRHSRASLRPATSSDPAVCAGQTGGSVMCVALAVRMHSVHCE